MIRIRHSAKPYEELQLEGSRSELFDLRSAILIFCEAAERVVELPAESEFNPSPYQQKLGRLRLCKTSDLLLITVSDGELFISGKPSFLRLFAENLPYNAHETSPIPYHVHIDRVGNEERISEASLDIVLMLR